MRRVMGVLLLAAVGGCGDVSGARMDASPAAQRQAEKAFLERAAGAPEFGMETVAITALAGSATTDTLRFANGEPFVALQLDEETMRGATLGGQPVPAGTPVVITVARASRGRFVAELQPSGLRFNPQAPARLTFFHRHSAPRRDAALQLWKQEHDEAPWERVAGPAKPDGDRFSASIDGFTKYAVASGN